MGRNEDKIKTEIRKVLGAALKSVDYKDFSEDERKIRIDIDHLHDQPEKLNEAIKEIAVYMFKYYDKYEKKDVWLKIGKVGEKSNPRFVSQHYNPNSCKSNLARQLLNDNDGKNENSYTGWKNIKDKCRGNDGKILEKIKDDEIKNEIKEWIKNNTVRINIYINLYGDEEYEQYKYFILSLFESALQCVYTPRYENNIHNNNESNKEKNK